ncbi:MAG: outer membrane beta-barrel protein [Ignavibacteriae bacterium]|nr:outer membrane beta-barrel protein [Ignavibacteriota bacterium]
MKQLKLIIVSLFFSTVLLSQNGNQNNNLWQVGFTFGEIPILSGSFKPGLTLGYHFSENIMAEITYQMKDYLQRDGESFNAVNIRFDGLKSAKETTGERVFIGMRYRPYDWSPYLTAGMVFNAEDIEVMKYQDLPRKIGDNSYSGEIEIVQKRESGYAPAFGLGYQYDFENGMSINTSFAMAFLSDISSPIIEINPIDEIADEDLEQQKENMDDIYKDNFHNRYHIFNLGIIYRFDLAE